MKKLFLVTLITICSITSINAQGFGAGVNLGIPTGDAGDAFTFAIGLDVNYMFDVSDTFYAGVAAGFTNSFLDSDFEGDDFQFAPLAVSGQYLVSEDIIVGADIGYAIGINEGNDGGFYYRPMVGYNMGEAIIIYANYTGISLDGPVDYTSFGVGVLLRL